jgi:DNA-binding NarL/FixJ family response regulator
MKSMEEPIRLVLVEDHLALRQGMALLLSRSGYAISGTAGDAREAYRRIRAVRPDVAVVDVRLPDESGVELTRRVLRDDPTLPVLLYTGIEDESTIRSMLDCGARGFALKAGPPEELQEAIRALAEGGTYMDPRLGAAILQRSTTAHLHVLSPREREILDLLAEGLTGAEAAMRLFLSPDTVRTHIRNAMAKLEANTRVHAVAIALRHREIPVQAESHRPRSAHAGRH